MLKESLKRVKIFISKCARSFFNRGSGRTEDWEFELILTAAVCTVQLPTRGRSHLFRPAPVQGEREGIDGAYHHHCWGDDGTVRGRWHGSTPISKCGTHMIVIKTNWFFSRIISNPRLQIFFFSCKDNCEPEVSENKATSGQGQLPGRFKRAVCALPGGGKGVTRAVHLINLRW